MTSENSQVEPMGAHQPASQPRRDVPAPIQALLGALAAIRLPEPREGWGQAPWADVVNGREYIIATNGWVLLAVERPLVPGVFPVAPKSVVDTMAAHARRDDAGHVVDGDALRAFAGKRDDCDTCKNSREVMCDECHGSGEVRCSCHCGHEHESECEECTNGKDACPDCSDGWQERPARFAGLVVNRSQLALVVAGASGPVRCDVQKTKHKDPVVVLSPESDATWFALLMPMRDHVPTEVTFEDRVTWATVSEQGESATR